MLFSSSWALLTLLAECFLALLHPLQWPHTFAPVLSGQMLDFLMAPTAFLMGCHLDHFAQVSKVSGSCRASRPVAGVPGGVHLRLCLAACPSGRIPGSLAQGSGNQVCAGPDCLCI